MSELLINKQQHPLDAGKETHHDIWTSLLQNSNLKKSYPKKNVVVLGYQKNGKTSIINHLKRSKVIKTTKPQIKNILNPEDAALYSDFPSTTQPSKDKDGSCYLLDTDYVDFADSETDDILTRLSFYKISELKLNNQKHTDLLKLVLNSETFLDSMVMIVLNWEHPFAFVKQLEYWFLILVDLVEKVENTNDNKWSKEKVIVEDAKEKLLKFFNEYNNRNYSTSDNLTNQTTSKTEEGLRLNLGIPILIVVNKSDILSNSEFETRYGYKEQHIDFIQQVLRTFCLTFGCGLIYTNIHDSITMEVMKQYMLYMLFKQPASYINTNSNNPVAGSYFQIFETQPQVYKNNCIFVPCGFDSYNKIKIINSDFDCVQCANYLLEDMEELRNPQNLEEHTINQFMKIKETSLEKMYANRIKMPLVSQKELNSKSKELEVAAIDEQVFLGQMHELLENTDPNSYEKNSKSTSGINLASSDAMEIDAFSLLKNKANEKIETLDSKDRQNQRDSGLGAPEQASALNKFFVELLNKNNEDEME